MRMPLAEPLRRRTYNTLHRDLCQSPACDADFVRHRIPYDATRTITLPKLRPCSRPMKASGARSRPSTMSSRYLMRPARTQAETSRRKSFDRSG